MSVSGRRQVNHGQALPSRPMSVVYLPQRYRSPILCSFVDFLVERFS
ncbi:hypothetical protein [Janthinobacterium sp. ROICE36]|nr:hypothetical protein [Janthinobacterium sp. ROICE36]